LTFCKNISGLGKMAAERGLHVQTHVSESLQEVEWVADLEPDCTSYTQVGGAPRPHPPHFYNFQT
jgi:cytosine/adenosine deaminase-related metal-dependent hydrolase